MMEEQEIRTCSAGKTLFMLDRYNISDRGGVIRLQITVVRLLLRWLGYCYA